MFICQKKNMRNTKKCLKYLINIFGYQSVAIGSKLSLVIWYTWELSIVWKNKLITQFYSKTIY